AGGRAQILAPGAAIAALPACPAQPRHADAVPDPEAIGVASRFDYGADDLVTRHEMRFRIGQLAIDDMQIGTAHGACPHADDELSGTGYRALEIDRTERPPRLVENHGAHRVLARCSVRS